MTHNKTKHGKTTHTTTVHARCPYMPVWDYYEVTFYPRKFVKVEVLEAACEKQRGKKMTQETLARQLSQSTPQHVGVSVVGRHGANCKTEIKW